MYKSIIVIVLISMISALPLHAVETPIQQAIDEGYKAYQEKDYQKSVNEFLKLYKRLDDDGVKMNIASYIGLSYRMIGDYLKSTSYFNEALGYASKIKDISSWAVIKGHIAENEKLLKNYQFAINNYNEAVSIEGVKAEDIATLYYGLADSYFLNENYEDAISTCNLATGVTSENPLEPIILNCAIIIGESYSKLDNIPEALKYIRNTYDRAYARGYYNTAIKSLLSMGDIYIGLNRVNTARAKYEDALSIMLDEKLINSNFYDIINFLSEPFFTNHNNLTLGAKLENYINLKGKEESYDNLSKILILSGEYYTLSKDYRKGLEIFVRAYQLAKSHNDNSGAVKSLTGLAYSNFMVGRSAIANLRIDEAIFRTKGIKDFAGLDELLYIKSLILAKNFRMIEAERLLNEAILLSEDEPNKIRYKDELKRVHLLAKEDRLKYGDQLDNLTAIERDNDSVVFSINELLTLDNPDVSDDEDAILNLDNLTEQPEDEESKQEATGDNETEADFVGDMLEDNSTATDNTTTNDMTATDNITTTDDIIATDNITATDDIITTDNITTTDNLTATDNT